MFMFQVKKKLARNDISRSRLRVLYLKIKDDLGNTTYATETHFSQREQCVIIKASNTG